MRRDSADRSICHPTHSQTSQASCPLRPRRSLAWSLTRKQRRQPADHGSNPRHLLDTTKLSVQFEERWRTERGDVGEPRNSCGGCREGARHPRGAYQWIVFATKKPESRFSDALRVHVESKAKLAHAYLSGPSEGIFRGRRAKKQEEQQDQRLWGLEKSMRMTIDRKRQLYLD